MPFPVIYVFINNKICSDGKLFVTKYSMPLSPILFYPMYKWIKLGYILFCIKLKAYEVIGLRKREI